MVGFRSKDPREMPAKVEEIFNRNIRKLLEIKPSDDVIQMDQKKNNSIELTFDEEAYQLMLQLEEEREEMLRNSDIPESFLGWLGKLTGQIIRIAALFHVADNVSSNTNDVPLTISKETLERANKLRDYFISHAEAAHGVMEANENDEDAKYIIKRITENKRLKDRESIDYQELWQVVKRKFKRSENLRKTLRYLEELNYVKNKLDGQKSIILINSYLFNKDKSVPNVPNSQEIAREQTLIEGINENLSGTSVPNNNELGALVQNRNIRGTSQEPYDNEASNELGALGTHSESNTNKTIMINEDGSGLL